MRRLPRLRGPARADEGGDPHDGRRNRSDVAAPPAVRGAARLAVPRRGRPRGWIKIEFVGRPELLNPASRVQGGFLAAMLDDTMGPAVFVKSEGALYASSIDMNVSFLAAAKPGPLVCEGAGLQRLADPG